MRCLVITRALTPTDGYRAALAGLVDEVVELPVTITAPAPADAVAALARAAGELARYQHVVVASARAAEALIAAATAAGTVAALAAATIDCVGAASAAPLRAIGAAPRLAAVATGAGVAAGMQVAPGARVLLPHAEHGRVDLRDALRAAGAEVDAIVAYRTVPAPRTPTLAAARRRLSTDAELIALFAPSQVTALAAWLDEDGDAFATLRARAVAIGPTTAAALTAAGAPPVAVAASPTPAALAAAIAGVYPASV
ncbi:MAG: uroporphyrinogen-III synthase [Kofleriaceae bacterium]